MLREDKPITREVFRQKVYESKPDGVRDTEIDFLFDLLDYTNDGKIEKNDFEAFRESGLLLLLIVNYIYSHVK